MGIVSWIKNFSNNTLYFPGCLAKHALRKEFENYKEILNKLDVPFILLEKDYCCGMPVANAGYKKDARKLAKKNLKLFKENSVVKIITGCPACYHMFKEIYPNLVRDWDIEIEHITVTLMEALRRKRVNFKGNEEDREEIVYHDPCYLGRYSKIYDEPREIIERLGGKVLEFKQNRENALCCGAGGGVRANFPELAKKAAKLRMAESPDAEARVISPCGLCFSNLKSASENVAEFSSFVLGKLRGRGL